MLINTKKIRQILNIINFPLQPSVFNAKQKYLPCFKYTFSALSDAINSRIPLVDPEDGEKLDNYLNRYHHSLFSAYLYKRRITRDQIYAKIHIIGDIPIEEQPHLNYQKLYPLKNPMSEKMMEKLVQQDPSNINSSYVISIFCEDHFKPMIDEYVSKVLVCGKAAKNEQKMNGVQQKVKSLYRIFYYGEEITNLQRQIELKYLSQKQYKYISHTTDIRYGKTNQLTRCKWKQQDQRILQDLVNWRQSNPQIDDTNFRPYYQPLNFLGRANTIEKMYQLMGMKNWYDKWKFNRKIKVYYTISNKYYALLTQKIYSRIYQYINSVEFTNLLKIPPDFTIEIAMFHLHLWLITDRLRKIDTIQTRYLANLLGQIFQKKLELRVATFNVKKEHILIKNLHKMMSDNSGVLKYHFEKSSITTPNPYYGADALVWTILFFEKVDRYGDQVYLMADYLVKNYKMLQNYNQEDLFNGMIQFDPYLVDPQYKASLQKINPPLSVAQFEVEKQSESIKKRYHYNYIQKGANIIKDRNKKVSKPVGTSFSWREQIFIPIKRMIKKYQTLETIDRYSQIEEQQKKQKQKQKDTIWKSKNQQLTDVKGEFQQVKTIKRKRKIWSNLK